VVGASRQEARQRLGALDPSALDSLRRSDAAWAAASAAAGGRARTAQVGAAPGVGPVRGGGLASPASSPASRIPPSRLPPPTFLAA
jgi:hypothetical protein